MYLVIVAVFLFTTLFFTSGHHLGTTGTIEEKENPMKNTLLDKGIITPSGEINKDKISLVAGAITQPFAEMVWVTTGGDKRHHHTNKRKEQNRERTGKELFQL